MSGFGGHEERYPGSSTSTYGLPPTAKSHSTRLYGTRTRKLSTPLHLVSVAPATAIYISKSMTGDPNRPSFSLVRRSCDSRGAGCGPLGAGPNPNGVEGRQARFTGRVRFTKTVPPFLRLSSAQRPQTIAQFWGWQTPATSGLPAVAAGAEEVCPGRSEVSVSVCVCVFMRRSARNTGPAGSAIRQTYGVRHRFDSVRPACQGAFYNEDHAAFH